MPRNGSGTYTLSDTIANATTADASELQAILTDIATALTGSMAADGQTPITGQMLGLVSTNPAWSFVADTNTGFGSDSADEAWIKAGGTEVATVTPTGLLVAGFITGTNLFANGTLGSVGNFAVNTNKFNVTAASGNTAVAGTLDVTGATTLTGGVGAVVSTGAISGTTVTASGALSGATAAGAQIATQAEMETGTATDKLTTPGRQHFHKAACKAWARITYSAGVPSLTEGYNVSSTVVDQAQGDCIINFTTALSTATYAVVTTSHGGVGYVNITSTSTTQIRFAFNNQTPTAADPTAFSFVVFGDI